MYIQLNFDNLLHWFFLIYLIFRLGSIGRTVPGLKTKLDNPDSNGEGEVCMYGRHIFMGYLNEPEKTGEALDGERWLHSGDVGKIDSNGFLHITGKLILKYKSFLISQC